MTRVYLSGPMSGIDQFNYPRFEYVARKLRSRGFRVISPHEINAGKHDLNTPESPAQRREYMRAALRGLLDPELEAIVMLDGWEASRGACVERSIALVLGLRIFEVWGDKNFDLIERRGM